MSLFDDIADDDIDTSPRKRRKVDAEAAAADDDASVDNDIDEKVHFEIRISADHLSLAAKILHNLSPNNDANIEVVCGQTKSADTVFRGIKLGVDIGGFCLFRASIPANTTYLDDDCTRREIEVLNQGRSSDEQHTHRPNECRVCLLPKTLKEALKNRIGLVTLTRADEGAEIVVASDDNHNIRSKTTVRINEPDIHWFESLNNFTAAESCSLKKASVLKDFIASVLAHNSDRFTLTVKTKDAGYSAEYGGNLVHQWFVFETSNVNSKHEKIIYAAVVTGNTAANVTSAASRGQQAERKKAYKTATVRYKETINAEPVRKFVQYISDNLTIMVRPEHDDMPPLLILEHPWGRSGYLRLVTTSYDNTEDEA
jgi:hypothetical protein